MRFSAKIASLVMALATCSVISAHGSVVVTREPAASPFVALYNTPGFQGDALLQTLSEGVNFNLPPGWVDYVGSVDIGYGYKCIFFTEPDAKGASTPPLERRVPVFIPPFRNHIESLTCNKAFV